MAAMHPTFGNSLQATIDRCMHGKAAMRRQTLPGYFPESLLQATRLIELEAGAFLFHEKAAVCALYLVVHGTIRLARPAQTGPTIVVQRAAAGDWLSEPGLCDDLHGSSAIAEDPSAVLAVAIRQFRVELRQNAEFALAWGLEMSDAVRRLQRWVERLMLPHACDRVIHYLVAESEGNDGEVNLEIPLNVWAGHLCIAPETLSRVLSKLCAEGVIERHGRTLKLTGKPERNDLKPKRGKGLAVHHD